MRNIFKRIARLVRTSEQRKNAFAKAAARFIEDNPDAFVFLADADTDVMIGAYKNVMVPVQLKQPDGKRMHIVSNALQYSRVEKSVDQLLLVVDSMFVNIAKELDNKRRKSLGADISHDFDEGSIERTVKGIKSPLQRSLKGK
jgi:hypothetical protein